MTQEGAKKATLLATNFYLLLQTIHCWIVAIDDGIERHTIIERFCNKLLSLTIVYSDCIYRNSCIFTSQFLRDIPTVHRIPRAISTQQLPQIHQECSKIANSSSFPYEALLLIRNDHRVPEIFAWRNKSDLHNSIDRNDRWSQFSALGIFLSTGETC